MERRQFLKNSTISGAIFALSGAKAFAASADARIEILLDEPQAVISPNIYGHFTEHIGGVIYDGVWVGKNSKIPNQNGIRSAIVERLRQIKAPVIRWPGGCFADSYDWRDGIGPANERPTRTSYWETEPDAARLHEKGPQIFEPNAFGTNEFVEFCRLSGAEPYIAANLRSLSALDFDHWVEYCNSPAGSTTLAGMRGAQGFREPFNVRYWGLGNEMAGYFTPEDYAMEFHRFTGWVPSYGVSLQFIGSGPSSDNGNDTDWTHRFFEKLFRDRPYINTSFTGWSLHHYVVNLSRGKSQDWNTCRGDALRFDPVDWYELLHESSQIEETIGNQWAAMGQYDPEHRIKLVVDEYGTVYREGSEVDPSHIFGQQITMRDALATALTLDIFNRNSDKVNLATCAQLVNNLNALFLAHEDRFIATPNYFVFEMYAAHQGGRYLRTVFSAPDVHYMRDDQPATFWSLNGSASQKGNVVTLTLVNPDLKQPKETQVDLRGAVLVHATGTVLADADMHAHNTFDHPDAVKLAPLDVTVSRGMLSVSIPPASVSKLEMIVA